ncbi:MAG: class I SAM-dependent methyltransferase [Vicinamibacteria bacterium]
MLRDRACPQCASFERAEYYRRAEFHIWICAKCSFAYTAPVLAPGDLRGHYERRNHSGHAELNIDTEESRRGRVWELGLRRLGQLVAPGRLLDVGCSVGGVLSAASRAGWSPVGVEISTRDAELVRSRLGFEVFCGTLEEAPFAQGSFDAVTFFDVLEHLLDPREALAAARRFLRPGGVLLARVPNFSFNRARIRMLQLIGPKEGVEMHLKLHVNHFDPSTLAEMLEGVGFARPRIEVGEADLFRGGAANAGKIAYSAAARAVLRCGGPNLGNIIEAYVAKS